VDIQVDPEDVERYILGKKKPYLQGIFQNVSDINRIGGIGMLSDLIDDFIKDEFDEFWDELTK
ncbi:MAG TPA: hypothetical protein VFC80_02380, partial [Sphaerochaeta sp.]|nr:hypothetical protein [Sphaerochaeta sp.]